MAAVAWDFGVLVFNDVLLDEGGPCVHALALLDGVVVDLSVWQESTVTWDVPRHFLGSDRKFIFFVAGHARRFVWQQVSGVVPKGSESLVELSIVAASRGAVGLSVCAPLWSLRHDSFHLCTLSGGAFIS